MIKYKYLLDPKISVAAAKQTIRNVSALYLTGDKAKETYAVLQPYMDFAETFHNSETMQINIKNRKINLNFQNIQQKYKKFLDFENNRNRLDSKRTEISNQLKSLSKSQLINQQEIENLKQEGKMIREELKTLKENSYELENDFIQDYLNLPNRLHMKCPTNENIQLLYREGLPPSNQSANFQSHLNHNDLIDFKNNSCYYLLNDAATFELDLTHNCTEFFVIQNFIQMTNPDFAHKIILEGNGIVDASPFQRIQQDDNNNNVKINSLHLNGGGSFSSFLGFVAKLSVFPSALPMKLIASGRKYYLNNSSEQKGLFTATQTNVVQAFIATTTEEEADNEFDTALNLVVDIYKKLDIHFQIIYETANNISSAECLRASIQMYSPHFKEYIEVGNLSNYSDYISKRILFNFKEGKTYKFPKIIGGTIIDITKVLGILIENNQKLNCPNYVEQKSSAVENFKGLFS